MSDRIGKKVNRVKVSNNTEMERANASTGQTESSKNEPLKFFMHLSNSALANLSVKSMPFETYAPVFYSPFRSDNLVDNTDEQESSLCKSDIVPYVMPDTVEANEHSLTTTNSLLSDYAEPAPNMITDPRIMVTNLPSGFKESDMKNFCSAFQIQSAELITADDSGEKSSSYIMVSTENFEHAIAISSRISGRNYHGNRLRTSAVWRLN